MPSGFSTQLKTASEGAALPPDEHDAREHSPGAFMRLKLGQHLYVAGMTGSGKTWFVREILTKVIPARVPIVVVDPKHKWQPPSAAWEIVDTLPRGWERHTSRERKPDLLRLVLRPQFMQDQRFNADLNQAYTRIFDRGRCVVDFEDAHELVNETRASTEFARLYRLGREDAQATAYANTQRPSALPRWMISEASHAIAFWLSDERDREISSKYMGKEVMLPPGPGKHDFWYRGPEPGKRPLLVHQ